MESSSIFPRVLMDRNIWVIWWTSLWAVVLFQHVPDTGSVQQRPESLIDLFMKTLMLMQRKSSVCFWCAFVQKLFSLRQCSHCYKRWRCWVCSGAAVRGCTNMSFRCGSATVTLLSTVGAEHSQNTVLSFMRQFIIYAPFLVCCFKWFSSRLLQDKKWWWLMGSFLNDRQDVVCSWKKHNKMLNGSFFFCSLIFNIVLSCAVCAHESSRPN